MKYERGSTLIVALILLTIITMVAVYSLEGSNIQSKMLANSLYSTLSYQECRNELIAQTRFMNIDGGVNRNEILAIVGADPDDPIASTFIPSDVLTKASSDHKVKSKIDLAWRYKGLAPRNGDEVGTDAIYVNYRYENDCVASFSFFQNSQTQGSAVQGLRNPNIVTY